MLGIYIHIPFCKRKCKYCDFNSAVGSSHEKDTYVDALIEEIRIYGEEVSTSVDTVFIGGGTPSILSEQQLKRLVDALKTSFDLSKVKEFSIEANPDTVTEVFARNLHALGINRVSMGLQSTDDDLLVTLGRLHSFDEFVVAYDLLRASGIENINVDLMFGLPNQTLEGWKNTVDRVLGLKPEHISAYSLKIEEGTDFYDLDEKGLLKIPEEDVEREMYHYLIERIGEAGYGQYEISNFSQKGCASKHNIIYWMNEDYLGLGLGSHGSFEGKRTSNIVDKASYEKACYSGKKPLEAVETIDEAESMFETVMLGLRLNQGVSIESFDKRYSQPFEAYYGHVTADLVKRRLLEVVHGYVRLTDYGRDISNQVMAEFIKEDL